MALRIRFQYPTGSSLGYSIERLSDRTFYDFSTNTFAAVPARLLAPLPEDTGPFHGRYLANLDPTPQATFKDGDYVVTVHDQDSVSAVVAELAATFHNGDDATYLPPTSATVGTSGAFSPAFLPGLLRWFDAADSATLTQSSGRVSAWADKSPHADHARQATVALMPTTGSQTVGGRNALSFPFGSNDSDNPFLVFDAPASFTAGATGFVVGGWSRNDQLGPFLAETSNNVYFGNLGVNFYLYDATGGINASAGFARDSTPRNYWFTSAANSQAAHAGAITIASTTSAKTIFGFSQIGRRYSGEYLAGFVGEIILCDGVLSAADISSTLAYLSSKWGTP